MLLALLALGFNRWPAWSSGASVRCSSGALMLLSHPALLGMHSLPARHRTHSFAPRHRHTRMQTGGEEEGAGSGRPDVLEQPAPPPPGAFHPGIVCAVKQQLIVGYRYERPATAADQQAAAAAGYQPIPTIRVATRGAGHLQARRADGRPVRLALAAFAASLILGSVGGVLSTGRLLDGRWNGAPPLEQLSDYAELPQLSPAEKLVALIFKPPTCEPESRTNCR
jgi:hypothetical protein